MWVVCKALFVSSFVVVLIKLFDVVNVFDRSIALDDVSVGASFLLTLAKRGMLKHLITLLQDRHSLSVWWYTHRCISVSQLHTRRRCITRGPGLEASYQTLCNDRCNSIPLQEHLTSWEEAAMYWSWWYPVPILLRWAGLRWYDGRENDSWELLEWRNTESG